MCLVSYSWILGILGEILLSIFHEKVLGQFTVGLALWKKGKFEAWKLPWAILTKPQSCISQELEKNCVGVSTGKEHARAFGHATKSRSHMPLARSSSIFSAHWEFSYILHNLKHGCASQISFSLFLGGYMVTKHACAIWVCFCTIILFLNFLIHKMASDKHHFHPLFSSESALFVFDNLVVCLTGFARVSLNFGSRSLRSTLFPSSG